MAEGDFPTRLQNQPIEPVFSAVPQVVGIEITGRCQLRCRHCFNWSGPDNSHELPLSSITSILDEMVKWGVNQVRLSGGEPTYHRCFPAVVAACQRRAIGITMNSHGVYSKAMLHDLKSAPIDLFIISVDGLEANHEAIRGPGTFKRAIHSCRELHAAGQQVMIGLHVGVMNQEDIAGIIAIAAGLGVDVKIAPVRPIGRALQELPDVMLQPRDYLAVVARVTALRRQYPQIKILTDFDILNRNPGGDCQRDLQMASCKAGRTMININYDGGIYPCAFFVTPKSEFCAGNIYRDSVTEVWQKSPVFEPFRVHRKSAACRACDHYQMHCAGGCPAIAHFTTGFLDAHDPTCFQILEQEQWANDVMQRTKS